MPNTPPTITVLIDNESLSSNLTKQHGLSICIQTSRSLILFDCGSNPSFIENAKKLGITISSTSHVVLSHGHYDHTAGVPALAEIANDFELVVGPEAWSPRRSSKPNGIPWSLDSINIKRVVTNRGSQQIEPSVAAFCTEGAKDAATRHPQFSRWTGDHWETDTFPDEQFLLLNTVQGAVVITGCTHCGIEAIIERTRQITDNTPVYALLGGLHTADYSDSQICNVAQELKDVRHIWINHCTGASSFLALKSILGDRVIWAGAGFSERLPPLIG